MLTLRYCSRVCDCGWLDIRERNREVAACVISGSGLRLISYIRA